MIKVHILKDNYVDEALYNEVLNIVTEIETYLQFIPGRKIINIDHLIGEVEKVDEENFTTLKSIKNPSYAYEKSNIFPVERKQASPKDILNFCENYRIQLDIADNDLVILLTELTNDLNWFSYCIPTKNAFIHTADWECFLKCDLKYPIAYEIIANSFYMILFTDMEDLWKNIHKEETVGCINDFCQNKKDIKLKMRTGDICEECQDLINQRNIDKRLVLQISQTMENVRLGMLALERFRQKLRPSKITFDNNGNIVFLELENYTIQLNPLERTVYHLFLNHPEGIRATDINNYHHELIDLYQKYSNIANYAYMMNSIDSLCDLMSNSLQEKISRIKRKIKLAVGDNLYKFYIIQKNDQGNYIIELDRAKIL